MSFVVIVYEAEEGGYWAQVPELPGCVSQGESLDELRANVVEAIHAYLASRDDDDSNSRRPFLTWSLRVPDVVAG